MPSSKNEFIKPGGRVKFPVVENYKLRGMVGLCEYGHILYYIFQFQQMSISATGGVTGTAEQYVIRGGSRGAEGAQAPP